MSFHLQPAPQRSDWQIDHRVTPAFLPLPSNSDDDVFMTRPRARGGKEERAPRGGGWKEREGGRREREREVNEVLFLRFVDGKLWHIDLSWTTATARPAGQTEREMKTEIC